MRERRPVPGSSTGKVNLPGQELCSPGIRLFRLSFAFCQLVTRKSHCISLRFRFFIGKRGEIFLK